MMNAHDVDAKFAGSIPQVYEQYLVPLIFAPYAADLAGRAAQRQPSRVLEIAAGTGVVTRQLAKVLPSATVIIATDLNQPMLEKAAAVGTSRTVEWRQADAMRLPFPDEDFDVVVCQFGAMFFPDKVKAFSEARRVLRPGGQFIFNVWDRIEQNEFADVVTHALEPLFPDSPPRFLARIPHGYHDLAVVAHDLACGGFPRLSESITLPVRSSADSSRIPALAFCQGTPLRNEIEDRAPSRLPEATDVVAEAIARRFGTGAVTGKMQANIITVERRE